MRSNGSATQSFFSVVCILFSSAIISGCASTYRYTYPGHKTFTESNVAKLEVGMSAEEVQMLFGSPDEEYTGTFGADVGMEWTGNTWLYFTDVDKSLMYAKRYKKNIFVFHPPDGDMKLNHWEFEGE